MKAELSKALMVTWVLKMARIIPWFPEDEESITFIAEAMADFIETEDQLVWLSSKAMKEISDWKKCGLPGLREMFGERFLLPEDQAELERSDAGHNRYLQLKAEIESEALATEPVEPETPSRVIPIAIRSMPEPVRDLKSISREELKAAEEALKQSRPQKTPEEIAEELYRYEEQLAEFQKARNS